MNYKKPLATIAIFISCLPAAWSQTDSGESLSLFEAISMTMESNPQIRSYQLRNEALKGELETAQLKPALRLSAEVENAFGTGELNWFQGSEFTVALSQVIELSDKRSVRSNVVSQRQNFMRAEQRITELEILSETTTHYIALAVALEMQTVLARSTQLAREILTEISSRVAAGRAPDADRSRAAAALAMAELAEQSANFDVATASLRLTSQWGAPRTNVISIDAELMEVEQLGDVNSLLAQLASNPAIEVFSSEARLREAELRAADNIRTTDIEVGAGIRHLAELNDTALLFRFDMPLGNKQRARGAITTAQANLLRVESDKEAALIRMQSQLLVLDQQRRSAVNEFNALQTSVLPQLQEALEATRIAFENGRYSYLELNAAQKELIDADLSLVKAASRAHLLRVEVERLSGETYNELINAEADNAFEGRGQQ